jgi:hypothetical protein
MFFSVILLQHQSSKYQYNQNNQGQAKTIQKEKEKTQKGIFIPVLQILIPIFDSAPGSRPNFEMRI